MVTSEHSDMEGMDRESNNCRQKEQRLLVMYGVITLPDFRQLSWT